MGNCGDQKLSPLPSPGGITPPLVYGAWCIRLESSRNTSRLVGRQQRIKPRHRGGGRDFTQSAASGNVRISTVEKPLRHSGGAGTDNEQGRLCTNRPGN